MLLAEVELEVGDPGGVLGLADEGSGTERMMCPVEHLLGGPSYHLAHPKGEQCAVGTSRTAVVHPCRRVAEHCGRGDEDGVDGPEVGEPDLVRPSQSRLGDHAAGNTDGDSTWGVFAAEGPAGRLEATYDAGGWTLTGTKPWCSLAGILSHGLVTAWTGAETRRLFAVRLAGPQVRVTDEPWVARGLPAVTSSPVEMDHAQAVPVGGDGWYLTRPGFAWGGIGVAAVWYGGSVGLARRLAAPSSRRLDQIGEAHLGAVDAILTAAGTLLADAAARVDDGRADGAAGAALALRVRQVVRRDAEEVLDHCQHALGPGPLVGEAEHAARVADLQLYLRQEHAERDQAALGRHLVEHPGDCLLYTSPSPRD